jgi:hypothetical protein
MFDGMEPESTADNAAMDEFLNDDDDGGMGMDTGADAGGFGEDMAPNDDPDTFGDAPMPESHPDAPWTEDQPSDPVPEPEPEKPNAMVEWRRQWRERMEEKDAAARKAKQERQEKARAALAQFYEQRESHKEKMQANNRAEEQELLAKQSDEKTNDNPWERIVSLIDTKEDAEKDVSRMKEMMIQLKHTPHKTLSN